MITEILGLAMVGLACLLVGWLLARLRHPCYCKECRIARGKLFMQGFEHGRKRALAEATRVLDRVSLGKPAEVGTVLEKGIGVVPFYQGHRAQREE